MRESRSRLERRGVEGDTPVGVTRRQVHGSRVARVGTLA